jgi:hypothetical protein
MAAAFCYAARMPYVVKGVSSLGVVTWLHPPGSRGIRSISIRAMAETFPTVGAAEDAIISMHNAFAAAGIRFSVIKIEGERRVTN